MSIPDTPAPSTRYRESRTFCHGPKPAEGTLSEAVNVGVLSTAFGGPYFGELLAGVARELTVTGGRLFAIQTVDAGTVEADFPDRPSFAHQVAWDHVAGFVVLLNGVSFDF